MQCRRRVQARLYDGAGITMPASHDIDPAEQSAMSTLTNEKSRTDILHRLRRAEGQLRGIQRMVEQGDPCLDIAGQMAAVRKALDSTYVRMTVCFMQQELQARLGTQRGRAAELDAVLEDVQALLSKIR